MHLVIRQQVIDDLQRPARRAFAERVCTHLREAHGAFVAHLADDALLRRVEAGLGLARRQGVRTQRGLALFVTIQFRACPDFSSHPLVSRYFADSPGQGDYALKRLVVEMTREDWAAVTGGRQ
ncbi:MAG: hypothetical protein FJW31_09095 [Acidobacteria bacterium]|nr:hypothetical protein [Acidobacteriota bacterium]